MTTSSARIESVYVLDTNALIWYLKLDKRLSAHVSAIFDAAERGETQLIVSAVVIAELFYADRKRSLFRDFAQTYADLKAKPYFQFADFIADDVLDFTADQAVPEMHDRIIAGLARRLGVPLVTSDHEITQSGLVKVAW